MSPSPERKDNKKRHGTAVTTTGFESSRVELTDTSLCVLCKGEHTLATCKKSSKGRSKQDWNFACQEEYASPVLVKVTQHEDARWKLSAKFVRSHIRPPSITSHLMIKHPGKPLKPRTIAWTAVILHATSLILPVWIHHKNDPHRQVKAYAVLDD